VFLILLFSYSLAILLLNAGIANTMDLPEKLLPRISSRMGIQRLCFGPYNYRQLQEIISSRLKGINAFEEQAIEFASRKVCILIVLMSISLLLSIVLLRVCLV
jgi:Cdc6-like AAA superfamily ATPase